MKRIATLLMIMTIAGSALGQKKGKQTDVGTVTYDFSTKTFSDISTLPRYNEPYRIEVINVDRLTYDIHIGADDLEFGSQEPELWRKYFGGAPSLAAASLAANNPKALTTTKESLTTYLSPPIYPKGSMLSVGISISPKDSGSISSASMDVPLTNDSLGIELRVRNKWNVSFSTGPFAVFKNNSSSESYFFQRQQDSTGLVSDSGYYSLVSAGTNSLPVGIAAFAHLNTLVANNFGLGFSLGVGVTTEADPKPVYMLGGTMFIGQKRQFCISLGMSLMQIDKLREDLYPKDAKYQSTQELKYRQVLTPGGFASLTYTLYTIERNRSARSKSAK